MQYFEAFDDLRGVYLEESWVLAISQDDASVTFEVEAVLTPDHARYASPGPGEQYCCAAGRLTVSSPSLALTLSGSAPAIDASGSTDLGNIDTFAQAGGSWHLEGEWGRLDAESPTVSLTITAR